MKELIEYRRHLLEKLEQAANEFRAACLAAKNPFAPLDADGWNVHQIAAHTRDVNALVYGLRARRTAQEDNPEFQNFDGDAYMADHYDQNESLNEILDGFTAEVSSLVTMLRELPVEAWSRVARHITLGNNFTLQTWVERNLAHIKEHLETIEKADR